MTSYRGGADRSGEGEYGKSQEMADKRSEGCGRGLIRPVKRAMSVSTGIKSDRKNSVPTLRYTDRLGS
jgi:hypothetical protein